MAPKQKNFWVNEPDIGHFIWYDILMIIAKKHNSINASC